MDWQPHWISHLKLFYFSQPDLVSTYEYWIISNESSSPVLIAWFQSKDSVCVEFWHILFCIVLWVLCRCSSFHYHYISITAFIMCAAAALLSQTHPSLGNSPLTLKFAVPIHVRKLAHSHSVSLLWINWAYYAFFVPLDSVVFILLTKMRNSYIYWTCRS